MNKYIVKYGVSGIFIRLVEAESHIKAVNYVASENMSGDDFRNEILCFELNKPKKYEIDREWKIREV